MKISKLGLILNLFSFTAFAGGGGPINNCKEFDPIILQETTLKVKDTLQYDVGVAKLISTLYSCAGSKRLSENLFVEVELFDYIESLDLNVLKSIFSAESSTSISLDAQKMVQFGRNIQTVMDAPVRLINASDEFPIPLLKYNFEREGSQSLSFWTSTSSGEPLAFITSEAVAKDSIPGLPNYRVLACSAKKFDVFFEFNKSSIIKSKVYASGRTHILQVPSICNPN
ncbi:MAG: hypothetical protein ACOYL6_15310 [Bacteriovoracaceae bacterium]